MIHVQDSRNQPDGRRIAWIKLFSVITEAVYLFIPSKGEKILKSLAAQKSKSASSEFGSSGCSDTQADETKA